MMHALERSETAAGAEALLDCFESAEGREALM